MRKLLIITCLLGIVFTTNAQWKRKNKKKDSNNVTVIDKNTTIIDYKSIGTTIPKMKVVTKDNEVYTTNDFHKNLVVMTFNPTCDHCMDMASIFSQNISLFKNTDVVMVAAPSMKDYLDFFIRNTDIAKHKSIIKVGLDSAGYIDKTFKYDGLPQLNFYDPNGKLVKVLSGDQPLDTVKAYIK